MEMRISDELNDIVKYAREEAMRTGNYGIRIDHLTLGIIRHGENDAFKVMTSLGISPDGLKDWIDTQVTRDGIIPYTQVDQVVLTRGSQNIINLSILEATRYKHSETRSIHLFLAICRSENGTSAYLKKFGIDLRTILSAVSESGYLDSVPKASAAQENGEQEVPKDETIEGAAPQPNPFQIEEYGVDLTKAAADGQLDPVVGREDEIGRVIEILGRRRKNNPMLIGEAGVGKSAIVEGIAMKIATGDIPPSLSQKRIISLDIASIVAGTRYRGDFEKRIKDLITYLKENQDTLLFIDEFHTLVGAGGAQGALDAAGLLKPALARGEIQCIGATTLDEFRKIVEKDGALDRRFHRVIVEANDVEQSIAILKKLQTRYEDYHQVAYTDEAVEACAKLTDRYISDKALPDKAIDAMDEAGSMVRLRKASGARKGSVVSAEDIAFVISRMTGIPVNKVAENEGSKLLKMGEKLKERIVGQDEAIETIARAIRRNRAGLKDPNRPIGTFLFFGPTGVGKTLLAKRIAEYLFDSEENIIRVDMSEYTEKISSSRLIGAPPGYVGHDEGGQLSEKVRQKPYSVVLLDEIEKAHPDIFNLLLQVLDEGRLTDSQGHTVNFKNTIVIMTSNVGSRELDEYGNGMGFTRAKKDVEADRKSVLEKAIKKAFAPEFINRVDEKVYFSPLTKDAIEKIIDIEIKSLVKRAAEAGYQLRITPGVKKFVADAGFDSVYGARPLRRAITKYIEDPVSEFIISDRMLGRTKKDTVLRVGLMRDKEGTQVTKLV